jgi:ABC-type sugar transport system ATPase subunit
MVTRDGHGTLEVADLSVTVGRREILAAVSFSAKAGEPVAIVGPSGSGKSTLLRTIAGLVIPTEGAVIVNGADVTSTEAGDRDVALAFQSPVLYPFLSVRENLRFPAKGWRSELDVRTKHVAEAFGLAHLLGRRVDTLSGGETQRVAVVRALVSNCGVLLMDEPLSDVDPLLARELRTLVRSETADRVLVYVTHNQQEAATIGHRVGVLSEGRLLQLDSVPDLLARPNALFVARFLGDPPLECVRGYIEMKSNQGIFSTSDGALRLVITLDSYHETAWCQQAVVCFGPRDALLMRTPDARPEGLIPTRLVGFEDSFGDYVTLLLHTEAGTTWRVPRPRGHVQPLLRGDCDITVGLCGLRVWVFAEATGHLRGTGCVASHAV